MTLIPLRLSPFSRDRLGAKILAVRTFVLVAPLAFASGLSAQTSYPMLARVHPVAVQRGHDAEIRIGGAGNFDGASALMFDGPGLSAEILATEAAAPKATKGAMRNPSTGSVRVKIAATADAALGPREFRVVTPRGVSSAGLVVVVAEPVVVEDDALNDDPATGQMIPLPSAVAGVVGKVEDVDWFAFRAEAGQSVVFTLWGNRLEDKIHDLQTHLDPILQLFDATGRELAANDNHHFADPMIAYTFQEAGIYRIQVRDTTYDGNPNWSYVLQATTAPVVATLFPMAVRPGETALVQVTGFNLDETKPAKVTVPADAVPGPIALPLMTDRGATAPVPMVATTLPLAAEVDDAPSAFASSQPAAFPVALDGRLQTPNDLDGFRFEAKKGILYSFEVTARRVGSTADPVLRLVDATGRTLAEADDTFGKDPRLEWTATTDGPVMAVVRDLHSRGGAGFGYVLSAEAGRPDFRVSCDPDKVNVGPGARGPVFVKVERRNGFSGAVSLAFEGLPPGVTASPLTVPTGMTQGLIVVTASPEAKLAAGLASLVGRAETPEGTIARPATPRQEIYLPGGGRGLYSVSTLPVAVTEPSDVTVEAVPKEVTLKPGQSATIEVTIARRPGYTGPVNLDVDLRHLGQVFASSLPPGVTMKTAASKTLIAPGATTGKIVLEAGPNALPGDPVPVCVMAHVSINFVVKTAYCSGPIAVKVVGK